MRDINVNKMSEGIDYELIPAQSDYDQAWNVRLLTGEFVETVISYGAISFDGRTKNLRFNFYLISSPDPDLSTTYVPFQEHAANVLEDILEKSHHEGTLLAKEVDELGEEVGDQFRTNDSQESAD